MNTEKLLEVINSMQARIDKQEEENKKNQLAIKKLRAERSVNCMTEKRSVKAFVERDKLESIFKFCCDRETGKIICPKKYDDWEPVWQRFYRGLLIPFHRYAENRTGDDAKFRICSYAISKMEEKEYQIFGKLVNDVVDLLYDAIQERNKLCKK